MSKLSDANPKARLLPSAVYLPGDETARILVAQCQRFNRSAYGELDKQRAEVVVLVSDTKLLDEYLKELRSPNVRIIAVSDERFADPRLDAAVYTYVPRRIPAALVERVIDNALDHMHLVLTRQDANERLAGATHEISELNKIGAALSAEHDVPRLLALILTKSREITMADAGSLYIVEEIEGGEEETPAEGRAEKKKQLRFMVAQNDTVEVAFKETAIPINESSIAGYVALHSETVMIEDSYHLSPDVPYQINRKFDEDSGYRTKSILAVPMRNQKNELVGVVQLINAKRTWSTRLNTVAAVTREVVPFAEKQRDIALSLASQAAVAYENSRLYESIRILFEGFVKASVTAIEARDPTTSGHSFRVANLTVALAEAADRDTGVFRELSFTREQMREIRYASLLHDFGKVGVREQVLVKAKKLYPSQLDVVRQRFDFVRRSVEAADSRKRLQYVLEKGRDEYLAQLPVFDKELKEQIEELDRGLAVILASDEPTVMPAGNFEQVLAIAASRYADWDNQMQPLLTPDEVRLLSIRKGSLDDDERLEIESHVVHTYNFLKEIPWTRELRDIPQIARGHHEKLNGHGYPHKLSAPEIPVQTRMMTVSDVFDALAASDRPYKRAVSVEKAIDILGFMVKDGEVDADIFRLFKEAEVPLRWKVEPFPY